jgi:pimeloyl-ACP methyl ester carboxylesterase
VPARRESFTHSSLAGVRLHALHWGDAAQPPLVLLHGGGSNAHWWDHLAPALAQDFHVVALDFRGHGDSDYPDETRVGAFGDDLDALLEHLEAPRAALMGHSMGAHIALERAARIRGTRALALLDLAWGMPRAARRSARRALSFRVTHRSRERAVERFRFLPSAARADEGLRRSIAEQSLREEPDGRFGFKFDPRWFALPYRKLPPLSGVDCPTLLVRGAESPFLSPEAAEGLRAELPRAELVELADAGHHVHVDQPAALLATVQAFLQRAL